jgi:Carbonic anhydrase
VPHIIVLGHSQCGGVTAYRQKVRGHAPTEGFIGRWLALLDNLNVLETDVFAHGEEVAFEFAAIRSSIANLRTFPFIKKRMQEGLLALCMACISTLEAARCLGATRVASASWRFIASSRSDFRARKSRFRVGNQPGVVGKVALTFRRLGPHSASCLCCSSC